ncbi:MAG TPA: carbohydrate ABC transporter substrate-binding protein, partial [Propionibacteriaceae bacterium]|nr:carbohydrate ABC transporter substrate-binding protein [Propionibacteriaceae bacterium]
MALAGLAVGALSLSACSAGSLGSSSGGSSGAAASTTITYLVDNGDATVKTATALVAAYNALNTGVTVKLDTRAQGTDGDNAGKTKLATGDMAEV